MAQARFSPLPGRVLRRQGLVVLQSHHENVSANPWTSQADHGRITAVTRGSVNHRRLRASLVSASLLASVALAGALPLGTTTQAQAAPVAASAEVASAPLRVASYNIRNANTYQKHKNEKRWVDRRAAVVAGIKGQDLDVLGVQEASQGLLSDATSQRNRTSQFDDLVARLGGGWKVTNDRHYNCVNTDSPNRCTKVDQGASGGTRILYDSTRVELLAQGSELLPLPKGEPEKYTAWAQLRQRSTGKRFMVANLHTVGTDAQYAYRTKQAKVALAALKEHNPGGLPMIALGDWNSSRFEKPSNGPYDVFVKAGFVDPLGQKYRSTSAVKPTAEKRVRAWINSSNPSWSRTAPNHKSWGQGSYIDYILTTKMRVSEWETVARLDKKGKFVGVIPSDHNMVRATVWLP
ncbi:Endonuclease/Exonuclease/phosphatase family protein [Microlunatus sagamiharensis]|uniref:Endonuclease/Exonuclease/phosphatase family protein n=1 Tax=Microlunatus sagamiharensis TaxID=546874 RepID=A0A1H2LXG1_9ACTN|nr:Endonuclease/Exonuclease/phosphatase family protein [Microlunatus sagamiharensis]